MEIQMVYLTTYMIQRLKKNLKTAALYLRIVKEKQEKMDYGCF